ncbi:MAG: hypothetical protein ACREBQ_13445 [Nitrososphaerales archaeon]
MEEGRKHVDRVAWGVARVAFLANLPTIQEQLNAGWPMSATYQRAKSSLGGMSYRAFTKLVGKYFGPTLRQPIRKYEAAKQIISSAATASVVASQAQRGSVNDEKPRDPGRPARFRPGPRIPNPKDIY